MGVSPIQYLNRYRVEQAKSLLSESDKSMEQIARQIGSSSQNYFSYLFRKTTGTTPRAYRLKAARIPRLLP
jgi:AraC-like DNA-binding protein